MILRYTRYETTFKDRDSAIEKLQKTQRYYGENVCAKYLDELGSVQLILALFKSERKGDYYINFDSGKNKAEGETGGKFNLYEISRKSGETDSECIARATLGSPGVAGDMVIIDHKVFYIYSGTTWDQLGQYDIDCGTLRDLE